MEDIKSLAYPEWDVLAKKFSPFLAEVRKRVLFVLLVFALATLVGFVFYESIIKFLIGILDLEGINIVFTSPFQFINLAIGCGVATGLTLSFPLLVIQILSFLKPALRQKEYKIVVRSLPFSIILFLVGFTFGALIMRWQIQIFLAKSVSLGIGNILDISRLLNTILITSAIMGVGFQFPLVLLILMRIGIIKHEQLSKRRSWIYLGSLFFAILLPQDSILADFLLALPLVVLFELTLLLNRILEYRKA